MVSMQEYLRETPMLTLNRLCGSGAQSIVTGSQMIMLGEAEIVVAGGMENLSGSTCSEGRAFNTQIGQAAPRGLYSDQGYGGLSVH